MASHIPGEPPSGGDARRVRVDEMRRAERSREQRNRILTIVAVVVIVAATLVGGYLVWTGTDDDQQDTQAQQDTPDGQDEQAQQDTSDEQDTPDGQDDGNPTDEEGPAQDEPIAGEQTWSDLGREHTTADVDYPMSPAAGGNHSPVWADCEASVYAEEIPEENAVHSLEHGAVWITYNDAAKASDVVALSQRVEQTPYTLMSPYPDQDARITLTAWGHQLGVEEASDPRIDAFLERYVQGEQTPEPGATCSSELRP